MNVFDLIFQWVSQALPVFRVAWAVLITLGLLMLGLAFVLKRNPARKKSPWIVGGLGALAVVSSGVQLIGSLL